MLVIASVDRKIEIEGAPKGKAAQYITDSEPVSVKPSNYYWRKIREGILIWICHSDTPPKNWFKSFHPVQQTRIATHIIAEAKKVATQKFKAKAEKAKAKKEKEAKKSAPGGAPAGPGSAAKK